MGKIMAERVVILAGGYAAFDFDKGEYNCAVYFGEKIQQDKDLMRSAKNAFEKENTQWELVAIRSMCTTERMPNYYDAYPDMPKPDKDGRMSAVQFVARHKRTGDLVETAWLFRNNYDSPENCARCGLNGCARYVGTVPVIRGAAVRALVLAYGKRK